MKKRLLCLVLAGVMTLSLAACRGNEKPAETKKPAETGETTAESTAKTGDYKIGIITGTASQGDEDEGKIRRYDRYIDISG